MRKTRKIWAGATIAALGAVASTSAAAQEEAGHMHGPDGRHVAVASTFGATAGKQILSHHDLMILDTRQPGPNGGKVVEGADVHSVVYRKGDRSEAVHREHNAYETEHGVYGSHMMYREPGEYVIVENVTMPDKTKFTLEFPIWVPNPEGTAEVHDRSSPIPYVLGGIGAVVMAVLAYWLGRRSAGAGATASVLALLVVSIPLTAARAQEEEAGHMHGPDGRHVALAETFGGGGPKPLKAFPTPDGKESADQRKDPYIFRLSIENEEMAPPDPNVVSLDAEAAKTIGLTVVPVAVLQTSSRLSTTGQVRPNPNRAVTLNSPVSGRVVRINVTKGQMVGAGHTAAVIDSSEIADAQSALIRSRAEVNQALAARNRSRAQAREALAIVDRFVAESEQARAKVAALRKTLQRQMQLAEAGAFSQGPVEEARSAVVHAEGELREAQTALAALEAQEKRLTQGLPEGLVARKEVEAAQAATTQGRTRLSTADRQVEIARTTLAREQRIQTQGLRNDREVQQAESDLDSASHALRAAEASVNSQRRALQAANAAVAESEADLSRVESSVRSAEQRIRVLGGSPGGGSQISIRTPIGGEVESRPVNVGESVTAGQILCSILNTDSVWVESDVFEKDLPKVRLGQPVSIAADAIPGRVFTGTVNYVGAQLDPQTRAVRVRTVVANSAGLLKPNMFVRALVGGGNDAALTVPESAVQEDGGQPVVFVKVGEGSYRRTPVRIGTKLGDLVVVEEGLKAGDRVVADGAYQLLARAGRS